jgi:hypothetical protein
MLKKTSALIIAGLVPVLVSTVASADTKSPWAASLGIGTTGINGGVLYKESNHFVADVDVGGFAVDPSFSAGGENYHMGIRLISARLTENWYPFSNGNLFLSAGVLLNKDKFNLKPASTQGNYSFATPASFHFSPVAPYLGIGWGDAFTGSRWSFLANLGAAYEGAAHVSVTMGTDPYATQAYQAEKASISSSLSSTHWYPVAQAAMVYRFG